MERRRNMITLLILITITIGVLFIAITALSVLGTFGVVVFADLIIAIFVLWFIFFRKR
jgi:hypothetical protein